MSGRSPALPRHPCHPEPWDRLLQGLAAPWVPQESLQEGPGIEVGVAELSLAEDVKSVLSHGLQSCGAWSLTAGAEPSPRDTEHNIACPS